MVRLFFRERSVKAITSVTGPTLPANIVKISQSFQGSGKLGVIPVVKPTVPNAETTSKSKFKNGALSLIQSIMVTKQTNDAEINTTVKAL